MSTIKQTISSLLPVRRDGQIPTTSGGFGGGSTGGGTGGGGGQSLTGGTNIGITGSTISVIDSPVFLGDLLVCGEIRSCGNVCALGDVMAFSSACAPINWWDSMPPATNSSLGGIKVGTGLSIVSGVLCTTGSSGAFYYAGVNTCIRWKICNWSCWY